MDRSQLLKEVEALYDQGRYIDAYVRSADLGPLRTWQGEERVLAARLSGNLGAAKQTRALQWLAQRECPQSHLVRYYAAREVLERKGPLRALQFIQTHDFSPAPAPLRADWASLKGYLYGFFRDFDRADAAHDEATSIDANRAWIFSERAAVLAMQDRYGEALETAQHALTLQPWYRPAVLECASQLVLLSRDEEAIALLDEASRFTQSAAIPSMRAMLLEERDRFDEARAELDRVVELSPLADKPYRKWLNRRRAHMAYECGDLKSAVELYRADGDPMLVELANSIEAAPPTAKRKLIDVPFVRQHHLTCSPATLTMIGRYWSKPTEHLSVAEKICFDGTPAHSERRWAEENGWYTREFTVTAEAAKRLSDLDIPFTLSTSETTSGHLQAVVGYDEFKKSLLIRDPYIPLVIEMFTDRALERYASTGPRGVAMVPIEQKHLIESIDLPDTELWNEYFQFNLAIDRHDRKAADEVLAKMKVAAPEHRLTLTAERVAASYDHDAVKLLAVIERLLERYPKDGNLALVKASCLGQLGRLQERLAWLEKVSAEPEADLIFKAQLARDLIDDARTADRGSRLLNQVIRRRPLDADNLHLLASYLWDKREYVRATELYRLATCLADKDERFAQSYVLAAQHLNQRETAVKLLEKRFARYAKRSATPARALVNALVAGDEMHRAQEVITRAIEERPEDGELLLFAALHRGRSANFDDVRVLLERAKNKTQETHWLRTAAELSSYEAKHLQSLEMWNEIAKREPLAVDAHRSIAWHLQELYTRETAIDYLRGVSNANPTFLPLQQLLLEYVSRVNPEETEQLVRRILEQTPDNSWARRELASNLILQKRYAEAKQELEQSAVIEPQHPGLFNIRGDLHLAMGDTSAAAEDFRAAIRLSIDNDYAMSRLVTMFEDVKERRAALTFVVDELNKQRTKGEGLFMLPALAADTLSPRELLEVLETAHRERPDLWQSWATLSRQYIQMNRANEALALTKQACDRFPLMPRMWLERAVAAQAAGDETDELDALERAQLIAPWWGEAARTLADAYTRRGQIEKARQALERAIAAFPSDAYNHGGLAHIHWQSLQPQNALDALEHALNLEPGYDWAWYQLLDWGAQAGQPQRAEQLVTAQRERRPNEARAWWNFARVINDPKRLEERLAALDRAIELSPRFTAAHDLKASLLARASRFSEAIAATHPLQFALARPAELRTREASIEAYRGNNARAIELTKALVDENPNDAAAWYRLVELHASGEKKEYRDIAYQMTQRFPANAGAWCLLGHAHDLMDEANSAEKAYKRSLEIAPDYHAPAFALFDMLMRRNDLAGAERALEILRRHHRGEDTTSRAAALAARRGAIDEVRPVLEQLAKSASSDLAAFEQSLVELEPKVKSKVIDKLFSDALAAPTVQPAMGAFWIRHLLRRKRFDRIKPALQSLRQTPQILQPALVSALNGLCEFQQFSLVKTLLGKFKVDLASSTQTWGSAGYAYLTTGQFKRLIKWMSDWRTRESVEPWMMLNLSVGYLMLNQQDRAAEVWKETVSRPDAASELASHHAWLAWHYAVNGDFEGAKRHNEAANPIYLDDFYKSISRCAGMVCQIAINQNDSVDVGNKIHQLTGEYGRLSDSILGLRVYQRSMSTIAMMTGSKQARKEAKRRPGGIGSTEISGLSWVYIAIITIIVIRALMTLAGNK